jgi:tetratricopeptide (TPR) repeat protein
LELSEKEFGIDCPLNIDIYKNMGNIYLEESKLDEADEFIQKALRIS